MLCPLFWFLLYTEKYLSVEDQKEMPTALSVENEITAFLARHNLDAARFCVIAGPPFTPTKLSQAFNDFKPLTGPEAELARKAMKAIDQLVEVCAPLPVNLRNPSIIRRLLKALEDNLLSIHIFIRREDWERTEI
jgi:hypothetical protein